MNNKNKVDSYSNYDCELVYDDYDKQESSYLDFEHYSSFVGDEEMEIPKEFDPYSIPINLEDNSKNNNDDVFTFKRPTRANEDNIRPISSFAKETSVFYDEKQDKMFSKRFQLVKRK